MFPFFFDSIVNNAGKLIFYNQQTGAFVHCNLRPFVKVSTDLFIPRIIMFFVFVVCLGCYFRLLCLVTSPDGQPCDSQVLHSSFPVSHKVGNVVNFVLGIEIKGIWSNLINLVLQLK